MAGYVSRKWLAGVDAEALQAESDQFAKDLETQLMAAQPAQPVVAPQAPEKPRSIVLPSIESLVPGAQAKPAEGARPRSIVLPSLESLTAVEDTKGVPLHPAGAPPTGAPAPPVQARLDASSPDAFIAGLSPAWQRVAQQHGLDAATMLALNAHETGWGKSQLAQENFNLGGWKGREPGTWSKFQSPDEFIQAQTEMLRTDPRYAKAWEQRANPGAFIQEIANAGYIQPDQADEWVQRVGALREQIAPKIPVGETRPPDVQRMARLDSGEDLTPDQYQAALGEGLDKATADAVCGPAAAIAFARANGRNPTMGEALDLAKEVGWTAENGMAGPVSQVKLLNRMGVAAKLTNGVDWDKVASDVSRNNPVIISTPGHYFVAERYDPETGMLDFGNSAKVLRAASGRRWFHPEELSSLGMGAATAAIYMDSPDSPAGSVVAGSSRMLSRV